MDLDNEVGKTAKSMVLKRRHREDAKQTLRDEREKLNLLRAPFTTLKLFLIESYLLLNSAVQSIVSNRWISGGVVAGLSVYGLLYALSRPEIEHIDFVMEYIVWWMGLGILSSIGLGSGLHSGMLFLFPHIFRVVTAANLCPTMNFDSFSDMWWRSVDMSCQDPVTNSNMECSSNQNHNVDLENCRAPFLQVLIRVMTPAFLWGTGTSMGEIPPYAVSRAAKAAGKSDEELDELRQLNSSSSSSTSTGNTGTGTGTDAGTGTGTGTGTRTNTTDANNNPNSNVDVVGSMKRWMVEFVEKYGFWGVLLMSAWPNAAFDLVGIVCGQMGISFWTFFFATFVGKALIKVNGQCLFFTTWFRHPEWVADVAKHLLSKLPEGLVEIDVDAKMSQLYKSVTTGKASEGNASIMRHFDKVVLAVVISFVISTINQLAQQRQASIDHEHLIEQYGTEPHQGSKAGDGDGASADSGGDSAAKGKEEETNRAPKNLDEKKRD